ncbi:MAG: NUDIX hydrolase [Saprospiraceae bacterium]
MPKPWKVLDSRYVYDKKPYMTLREDTVELANGSRIDDFFIFEYPNWVSVLPVTPEGNLVLIRQYRHGVGRVIPELVAGVIDPQEDPLLAAQRELLEETGFSGGEWSHLLTASANPSTHTNVCTIYLAYGVERLHTQILDATEEIEVEVLKPETVFAMLNENAFVQALHAAALWKYFALTGKTN